MIEEMKHIARKAGEVILDGYKNNFKIFYKTNLSNLVTEIDKKSEELIIEFVNKNFSGHSIIAEESGKSQKKSDYLWVIDPLDGTTNFAHGLPLFSVSIGVCKNNETLYGVVYDVMHNKLFAAEKGKGAFCNGEKLSVSTVKQLERSLLVTGFPYDLGRNFDIALNRFGKFLKKSQAVRRLGSAAIDLCYVAEGIFEGFWEEQLNPWDVAAGMLIVEEAGGSISDFNGNKIDLYAKEILATNGHIAEEMIKVINSI